MYDVIVVGGGHAGIEAAMACSKAQYKTALITLSINNIGKMPCNPSIGGPAKGIVVKEIDALGGVMPYVADKTALQFKMLNKAKGPGVQSLRVQSDKLAYSKLMQELCLAQEHLDVIEDICTGLVVSDKVAKGVILKEKGILESKIVILTTGTYMASLCMISDEVTESGPDSEPTTNDLSACLKALGFELFRLKTGTPPRVKTESIDFSKTQYEPGTDEDITFSQRGTALPLDQQVPCYLTYTNSKTHKIINANLHRSSMYSGVVKGVGPRYCPSIEDKLVRFHDKERHQIFLEPESLSLDTTYVQGFSTSLPKEVQAEMIKTLPGLEHAVIEKYAYAIEYDAINPLQMKPTLESKLIENLFTAGQINGTSGYEEAAGQGIMAGINAINKLMDKEPLILRRDEAYIGVLIDDLCTKGTLEPYRLLTSRAEFRLLLRHDNADKRLMEYGYQAKLVSKKRYEEYLEKYRKVEEYKQKLNEVRFNSKSEVNAYLKTIGFEALSEGMSALKLIARPHVTIEGILPYLDFMIEKEVAHLIEIDVKYQGYIEKAKKEASKMHNMEKLRLPEHINYDEVANLSLEARSKLKQCRPMTIGQASRISGVNPSDIQVLAIYLEMKRREKQHALQ